MPFLRRWLLGIVLMPGMLLPLTPSVAVSQVPINTIQVGDGYYIYRVTRPNDLVTVLQVDRAGNQVKIRYPDGSIDWVRPDVLKTRTAARDADATGAVVGTALVAGTIWAIVDPQGFRQAMSGRPATSAPTPARAAPAPTAPRLARTSAPASPAIAIEATPFAPLVAGEWAVESAEWTAWAERFLDGALPASTTRPVIERVRSKPLPFYGSTGRRVNLVEMVESGNRSALYALVIPGEQAVNVLLGSNGAPIHQFNRRHGLRLVSDGDVEAYLKFFSSAVAADSGVFLVVDDDATFLSAGSKQRIGVSSTTVARTGTDTWQVRADVLYSGVLFRATFKVAADGMVEMLDDQPKVAVSPQYRVAIAGFRRFYVAGR